ncbi:hypothetical protein MHUMG1_09027 [Metarhizium humberi]|uniref:VOC domain-containing protein n=1 Tax=Metarhizium humberi TaxID=2596975 RepID=A0A9P8M758_9HYPO|nr:hypothetical protein MHUMG1_09027 [Metarhizium humberi]
MAQLFKSDDESSAVIIMPQTGSVDVELMDVSTSTNDKTEGDEEKKVHLKGMVSDSKTLFAKYDEQGNRSWSDRKPADFEEAAEGEETQKFAIIVRKQKPKDADSTKNLEIDSIIIQSPHLKKVLGDVFRGYPGIMTRLSRLKLKAPFECFLHRWEQFEAARDAEDQDPTAKEHLDLLHGIMKEELGDIINLRKDYFKNKSVTFDDLWTIFPPDCTVFGIKEGKPVAALFKRGSFECGKEYILECKIIDWDGVKMGWSSLKLHIPAFLGFANFSSLPSYPIEYCSNPEAIKETLRERGRRFESLAGFCYRQYEGVAVYHPEQNTDKTCRETVQGRIVVDCVNWQKNNPDHILWLDNLSPSDDNNNDDADSDDGSPNGNGHASPNADSQAQAPLTQDQLVYTSPVVRGYSLSSKHWMEFFVDNITDVQFDANAFNSLVMAPEKKEVILAFAESQARFKNAFDDVISGKGKGIIMLLCGGTGTGKTLTAESVAEEMRVPMYSMSAGDLGNSAYEVEGRLGRILKMVSNWNAVLMLDECDVFLEERTADNIERNRIVAIFLRMLEYYEGILFLTTNRVKRMDPAFHSRIHITMEYPPLDEEARAQVWRTFLERSRGEEGHDVTEGEVKRLSALDVNGRVIKNMVKAGRFGSTHRVNGTRSEYKVASAMPPKLGQIVETVLYTSDVARLAKWYRDIMGIVPFHENPRSAGFSLPNDTILLLFDRKKTKEDKIFPTGVIPKHGTETGLGQHMAFACASHDELSQWERHFKNKNVDIIARMSWELGGKSVYVKDWEGHVIEVMTRGVWPVY